MTRVIRRLLATFREIGISIRDDERAYGHYSRALGWLMWALLVGIVLAAVWMAADRPAADPECRRRAGTASTAVQALALELARSPADVRDLLIGDTTDTQRPPDPLLEAECVEDRAETYRDVIWIDSALFIPLYTVLGCVALCWLLAIGVHGGWDRPPLRFIVFLALSLGTVLVTAELDAKENRMAIHVLDLASGQDALTPDAMTAWSGAVDSLRLVSLKKWIVTGWWMATLTALVWNQRVVLGRLPRGRWPRAAPMLVKVAIAIGAIGTVALWAGAVGGLHPVETYVMMQWWNGLIMGGFASLFVFAFVLGLLDLTRR